jgi:tRNA pseudouridine32 synthase/23S rRNA pseudouridine746 synthase
VENIKFLHSFENDISEIELPEKFTYPFYYNPGKLMLIAVEQIQARLSAYPFKHNFGFDNSNKNQIVGKMFGVLIVKSKNNELGILTTHSGELLDQDELNMFVPSIVNHTQLDKKKDEQKQKVSKINEQIIEIEKSKAYIDLQIQQKNLKQNNFEKISNLKSIMKKAKTLRNQKRKSLDLTTDNKDILDGLIKESLHYKHELKLLNNKVKISETNFAQKSSIYINKIQSLKENRQVILSDLQKYELDLYQFKNYKNETKSLLNIFDEFANFNPPAGTGNCSAPKLLQYAYSNNLKPIAMSEFWWGAPHKSELKRHKNFYPACTSRCKPILTHMLEGLDVQENELLINYAKDSVIQTIYEDDYILVINKPHGLLSVPGKDIQDSVAQRMKELYPKASGPLVVHRLDQETSGIMLIAKDEDIYKSLQKQFIDRSIKKKYLAILSQKLKETSGVIDLPLKGDINNRPYQLVCENEGKKAKTHFRVIESVDNQTRIEFEPITGRTHQLRLHSAHFRGLNAPIVGDTLYGQKHKRLLLHASWIQFKHPKTFEILEFSSLADF